MFCPSHIKNYIITGLVSNFFNVPCNRVTFSLQKRNHHKTTATWNREKCEALVRLTFSNRYVSYFNCNIKHTYITGHNNPSVRIIDLVSHTTYVVCVNFLYISGGTYKFKVDSERQIFWETFHGNFYLRSEFLPQICWEEIAEEIFFVFRFDVWSGTRTLAFRLIS